MRSAVIALVCMSCREPDKIIPPGVPRMLLSESDFHDPDRRDGGAWLQLSQGRSFSQFNSYPFISVGRSCLHSCSLSTVALHRWIAPALGLAKGVRYLLQLPGRGVE